MADLTERDQALLLDMLLAANDAREFFSGMEKDQFLSNKPYQNNSALRGIPHRRLHADRDCAKSCISPLDRELNCRARGRRKKQDLALRSLTSGLLQ